MTVCRWLVPGRLLVGRLGIANYTSPREQMIRGFRRPKPGLTKNNEGEQLVSKVGKSLHCFFTDKRQRTSPLGRPRASSEQVVGDLGTVFAKRTVNLSATGAACRRSGCGDDVRTRSIGKATPIIGPP
jgi:hypothetical protein